MLPPHAGAAGTSDATGSRPVVLVEPDRGWPAAFEAARAALEPLLAPWAVTDLQHIGSTSVPGLPAKPILDLMIGVAALAAARAAVPVLVAAGWTDEPHRQHEAHHLVRYASAGTPTHGLHLTEVGSPLWRERLAFREGLRADPAVRDAYARLKSGLAATSPDLRSYTDGKRRFVADVLAGDGIDLVPRVGPA